MCHDSTQAKPKRGDLTSSRRKSAMVRQNEEEAAILTRRTGCIIPSTQQSHHTSKMIGMINASTCPIAFGIWRPVSVLPCFVWGNSDVISDSAFETLMERQHTDIKLHSFHLCLQGAVLSGVIVYEAAHFVKRTF